MIVDGVVRRGLLVEVTSSSDLKEVTGEVAIQRSGEEHPHSGNSKHEVGTEGEKRGVYRGWQGPDEAGLEGQGSAGL